MGPTRIDPVAHARSVVIRHVVTEFCRNGSHASTASAPTRTVERAAPLRPAPGNAATPELRGWFDDELANSAEISMLRNVIVMVCLLLFSVLAFVWYLCAG